MFSQIAAEEARLAALVQKRYDELSRLGASQDKRKNLLDALRRRLDEEGRDAIVKACQGLTRAEAENALAKAIRLLIWRQ